MKIVPEIIKLRGDTMHSSHPLLWTLVCAMLFFTLELYWPHGLWFAIPILPLRGVWLDEDQGKR